MRPWCTIIEDQGHLGSCTGNAMVGALQLMWHRQSPQKWQLLSRLFVYYNARLLEDDVKKDEGAYISDAVKSVALYGACLEDVWPYDIDSFAITPSTTAYDNAKGYKIKNYSQVDTLENMLDALNEGYPITFSFRAYSGFQEMDEGNGTVNNCLIPDPKKDEQPIGGHAMVMIGYDLSKKRILCLNSFGKYWCNSGTCWMTFDYAKNEVMDGWVFDLDFA
jgi:C1A family cysteine protease